MNPKLQTALFAKILDTLDVTLHWKKQTALQVGAKKEHKANSSKPGKLWVWKLWE